MSAESLALIAPLGKRTRDGVGAVGWVWSEIAVPPPFVRHVFVCLHERPEGTSSCGPRGAAEIHQRLKDEVRARGLKAEIRVNRAGCLDACSVGPSIVVYPDGVWYARVTADDVTEIVASHLEGGTPVQRLLGPQP